MKKILRISFGLSLIFLLSANARAGEEKKKKYEISEMPKALYLIAPESKEAYQEFSEENCPGLKPKSHSAYGYLEMLVLAGERRSGSQEMRCALSAVREVLKGFGYQVSEQAYLFPYYLVEEGLFEIKSLDSGKVPPSFPLMYSPATESELKGKLERPINIKKGDLVLVKGTMLSRKSLGEKAKDWQKKGVVGLVLDPRMFPFNPAGLPFPRSIHSTSWHYGALPGIVVQDAQELLGKEVEFKNQCQIYAGKGYNIIAQTPGEFESYILIGAHLDSWYLGALDDGTGVAVMLRMAELLKEEEGGKTGLIFLAFDGEELGLIGSSVFYEKFGAEKVKAMLNLDMVSIKNNFLYRTPEGAKIMPKIISASPELKVLARESYSGIKSVKIYSGLEWWRSIYRGLPTDLEWFYSAGVPGVFIYTPDKYYHTPLDDLTWMSPEDLEEVAFASVELVKKLSALELPRRPEPLQMDFNLLLQEDQTIAFQVDLKKGERIRLKAKPIVYCYYEHGFEKKVELKRGQGGSYRGSFAPVYKGEYQFVAVAVFEKEVRKAIRSIWIEEPVKSVEPKNQEVN